MRFILDFSLMDAISHLLSRTIDCYQVGLQQEVVNVAFVDDLGHYQHTPHAQCGDSLGYCLHGFGRRLQWHYIGGSYHLARTNAVKRIGRGVGDTFNTRRPTTHTKTPATSEGVDEGEHWPAIACNGISFGGGQHEIFKWRTPLPNQVECLLKN